MEKHIIYKYAIAICCLMLGIMETSAQTSGDRLYNQGLELQKKQTIAAQNSAIAKFRSAKKLYDSAVKKKQCDNAVQVSLNIIQSLKRGTGSYSVKTRTNTGNNKYMPPAAEPETTLSLSNTRLTLDDDYKTVSVTVTTNVKEWSVAPVSNSDGTSFLSVNKDGENNTFEIVCPANNTTHKRSQEVEVVAGTAKKRVIVEQESKPVTLVAEKNLLEFPHKGGNKTIEIYCNSDIIVKENYDQNWKIISKPQWVEIVVEAKKNKNFLGKVADFATDLVKGNVSVADDPNIKTSTVKVVVSGISKKDSEGRKGEIVLGSGKQHTTIMLIQK